MPPRHSIRIYQGNELACNSSGNTLTQSSKHAEPMWTDPDLQSGIGVRELFSALIKRGKKRRQGTIRRTSPKNPGMHAEKATPKASTGLKASQGRETRPFLPTQDHHHHHHHHHLSLNHEGLWGTTDDFTTSFLHFSPVLD